MNKIGVIQGRLSERPYPKLQEFPWNTWEREFCYASEIGYDFIEWIFEGNRYDENPIWTEEGRQLIKKCSQNTGIYVGSVCADYFLEKPFFRRDGYGLENNIYILKELVKKTSDIGANIILLPVLENAEIRMPEEEKILDEVIYSIIPTLEAYDVSIGFETELPIEHYTELSSKFKSNYVGAYYDAGNCAFCGHDMKKDMEMLKDYLLAVHVKDRIKGGKSVFLGTGDTNFNEGIPYLVKSGFNGNFVMQTYFEDDYMGDAMKNLEYIKKLMEI